MKESKPYWEDLEKYAVNREPARCSFHTLPGPGKRPGRRPFAVLLFPERGMGF